MDGGGWGRVRIGILTTGGPSYQQALTQHPPPFRAQQKMGCPWAGAGALCLRGALLPHGIMPLCQPLRPCGAAAPPLGAAIWFRSDVHVHQSESMAPWVRTPGTCGGTMLSRRHRSHPVTPTP